MRPSGQEEKGKATVNMEEKPAGKDKIKKSQYPWEQPVITALLKAESDGRRSIVSYALEGISFKEGDSLLLTVFFKWKILILPIPEVFIVHHIPLFQQDKAVKEVFNYIKTEDRDEKPVRISM